MNKDTFFKRKPGSTRKDALDLDFSLDKPVIEAVD
jgi:hypothetical protein